MPAGGTRSGGGRTSPIERSPRARGDDRYDTAWRRSRANYLRRGRWKLLCDAKGHGEPYDLAADPAELTNLFDDAEHAHVRANLVEELLRWTIRTDDDVPAAAYTPKRAEHNWHVTAADP